MKPADITRTRISTSLWISFGVVLLILGATLLIYAWQSRQISGRAELVSGMQAFEQAAWEMRQSNSDIARHLSDYARDPNKNHTKELRDSETAFERAALIFSQLARSDDTKSQSREINTAYGELKKSADKVISLVDQQQAALLSVRGMAGETADLMQGMLAATINDGSQSNQEKLETVIDMSHRLETMSAGIDAYTHGADPSIRQQVLNAGADFKRLSASFQSLALSPLESS